MSEDPNTPPQLDTAHISRALGLFLVIFGLVILVAIFFTDTPEGRITNLIAGLLIGGIGSGMMLRAKYGRRE